MKAPKTGLNVLEQLYDCTSSNYDQLRQELDMGPATYELLVNGLQRNGWISIIMNDGVRRIAITSNGRRRYQTYVLETIDLQGLEPQ